MASHTERHFAQEAYRLALTHGRLVSTVKNTMHHVTRTVDFEKKVVFVENRTTGEMVTVPIAKSWL